MLEIFILIKLTQSLSAKAASRGQPKIWGGLGPAFWIGGEVAGIVVGALLGLDFVLLYAMALALAITGAVVSWVIVSNLPENPEAMPVDQKPYGSV